MNASTLSVKRIFAAAALAIAMIALTAGAHASTFISGFNGDLTSTLGVDWEVQPSASTVPPAFVDPLTEGTQALQITNDPVNGSWPAISLPGGAALANIIATHRTLVLDVAPTVDLAWRQVFLALNSGNPSHWDQSTQFDLALPVEGDLSDQVAFDLTAGETSWQDRAKAWLAQPPGEQIWFEFVISIQGASGSGEAPLTTFDNVRFLAADFVNDQDGDLVLEALVNDVDLAAWKTGYGVDATGDADGDLDSDGNDFLIWQRELKEPPPVVAAATPEPAGAALAGLAALTIGARRIRRRF